MFGRRVRVSLGAAAGSLLLLVPATGMAASPDAGSDCSISLRASSGGFSSTNVQTISNSSTSANGETSCTASIEISAGDDGQPRCEAKAEARSGTRRAFDQDEGQGNCSVVATAKVVDGVPEADATVSPAGPEASDTIESSGVSDLDL